MGDLVRGPSFATIAFLILIPLGLILLNTASEVVLEEGVPLRSLLTFLGHPFAALLIAVLLAMVLIGRQQGYTKEDLQKIATRALQPAGLIILITGAGGAFRQVLIDSGVGDFLADAMAEAALPVMFLAWLVAAAVRVMQGSATVALITTAVSSLR